MQDVTAHFSMIRAIKYAHLASRTATVASSVSLTGAPVTNVQIDSSFHRELTALPTVKVAVNLTTCARDATETNAYSASGATTNG